MRRLNFILYITLIVLLPISVILLSGNAVLRIAETYTYHFNDSQVIEELGSSLTGAEFSREISGYFNKPSKEAFQVYEENGEYQDPIFDETESRAMAKAKMLMTITLFSGIVLFGGSIAVYMYMTTCVERVVLRVVGFIALAISAVGILVVDFLIKSSGFRITLYNRFIGINLGSGSALKLLLGTPFQNTYIIFSSVLGIAIIGILIYIHHSITRERRLFS